MLFRRLHVIIGSVFAFVALISPPLSAQMHAENWNAIARKLVERMALSKGERVYLLGAPGASDALIAPLRAAIREAGGEDLGALSTTGVSPAEWQTAWTRSAPASVAALESYLRNTDLGVMLPGAGVGDSAYAAMQRILRSGAGRTIHFHWSGAYALDGSVIPVTPERSTVYERALVTTDYVGLGAVQQTFEQALRGATVRVTTPDGTDLSFRVGERPVTRQDGDASKARAERARNLIDREVELPAGAIRVAPLEESVNGTVAFPDGEWGGERVEGLRMTFEKGRMTRFDARRGRAGVEKELITGGDAARAFREFVLGFNPLLAVPAHGDRWIPYYGYGSGVVRLSLGDNSELGGAVRGEYLRWNLFANTTVWVGGVVWVRDGALQRR